MCSEHIPVVYCTGYKRIIKATCMCIWTDKKLVWLWPCKLWELAQQRHQMESWPQYSLNPHATSSIIHILSNRVSDSWNVPSLKQSAKFCCVLSIIFRYTAGTHVSTVVTSLDFTSRSSDYVLSKAGLFSTKLSLTIIAWTQLLQDIMQWINTTQNHHFY